jgi:hypothetical protein
MKFMHVSHPRVKVKEQNCSGQKLEDIMHTITPPGFVITKKKSKSP